MSNVKDVKNSDSAVELKNEKTSVEIEDNKRLEEVLRGYRILNFDKDHFLPRLFKINSVRIYDKSVLSISRYGDEMFTRTKNRLIRDNEFLTYQEQREMLVNRNLWDDDKEQKLESLRQKAAALVEKKDADLSKIVNADKSSKAKKEREKAEETIKEWQEVYAEFSELAATQIVYFQDTIEMQAEAAQRKGWIVSSVTRDEGDNKYNKDNRVWKDIEEFEDTMTAGNMTTIITECVDFWDFASKEAESFFVESPEDQISDSDGETLKK